ncbi:MAG: T9SS type A sorting domain-containing protein, partial [Bacteroidia bacterium]|nr:T9SS type A sorting domain-containing protein [Bacteroidia bacterium]
NPVENKVKITNLPATCTVRIYTSDGGLVKKIIKDDESTELTWNLKNNANVPIASGTYLIHVDGGALGEKVVKWMGVMRELDLDSF